MLPFQSRSCLLNACVTTNEYPSGAEAKTKQERSTAPNAVVVVIYLRVIVVYSKYKLVLMISVVSGQIIHQFITSLKERESVHTGNDITSGAD